MHLVMTESLFYLAGPFNQHIGSFNEYLGQTTSLPSCADVTAFRCGFAVIRTGLEYLRIAGNGWRNT